MDDKNVSDVSTNNERRVKSGSLNTFQRSFSSIARISTSKSLGESQKSGSYKQRNSSRSNDIDLILFKHSVEDTALSKTIIKEESRESNLDEENINVVKEEWNDSFNENSLEEEKTDEVKEEKESSDELKSNRKESENLFDQTEFFYKPDYYPLDDFLIEKGNESLICDKIEGEKTHTTSKSEEKSLKSKGSKTDSYNLKLKSSVTRGDFKILRNSDEILFSTLMPVYYEEEEQLEKEVQEEVKLSDHKMKMKAINRNECNQQVKDLLINMRRLKALNNLLQRHIALYFKKRNKAHLLKESFSAAEWLKYVKEYIVKLETYGKLIETSSIQHSTMEQQIKNLETKKASKEQEVQIMCNELTNREIEVGRDLILKRTGKLMSEWLINQYIRRQRAVIKSQSELRSEYIKLKIMISEKEHKINKIGDLDYLNRYMTYKYDNKKSIDKLEEIEEMLINQRDHAKKTFATLSHIRLKSAAVESDNEDMRNKLNDLEKMLMDLRRKVINLKREKAKYYSLTKSLREESGLLVEPVLLIDMENNQKLLIQLKNTLEELKIQFADVSQKNTNIKTRIKFFDKSNPFEWINLKHAKSKKKINKPILYTKPTPIVFKPQLPKDAFFDYQPIVKKILV